MSKDQDLKASFLYGIVNPQWLCLKALNIFLFGGFSAFSPFIVLFLVSRGLTAAQISLIEFLNISIGIVSGPIVGGIADKTGKHNLALGLCILASAFPYFAMYFVPYSTAALNSINSYQTLTCQSNGTIELTGCASARFSVANISIGHTVAVGAENFTKQSCSTISGSRYQCSLSCSNFSRWFVEQVDVNNYELLVDKISSEENCSSMVFKVDERNSQSPKSPTCKTGDSLFCIITCGCEDVISSQPNPNTITFTFYVIIVLRSIGAISFGPTLSLADAVVYGVLGKEHTGLWGQQRLFATIAYASVAMLVGLAIDFFATFAPGFCTFIAMTTTSSLIAIFWVPNDTQAGDSGKLSLLAGLRISLVSPIFWLNSVVAVSAGLLLSATHVAYPHFLSTLGAPKSLYGTIVIVCCISEIPFLFFAASFIKRLGEITCIILMFAAFAVRYVFVACLTAPIVWLAMLSDVLHVFCYTMYFCAGTRIAAVIAPSGVAATVQASFHVCYSGIGLGFGILLTSHVYERFGARRAFLSFSAFAAVNCLLLLLLYFTYFRKIFTGLSELQQKAHRRPSYRDEGTPPDSTVRLGILVENDAEK